MTVNQLKHVHGLNFILTIRYAAANNLIKRSRTLTSNGALLNTWRESAIRIFEKCGYRAHSSSNGILLEDVSNSLDIEEGTVMNQSTVFKNIHFSFGDNILRVREILCLQV